MTDHTLPDSEPAAVGGSAQGGRRPADDRKVPWRVFGAIGGFIAVMGIIYWAAAYEESGTVMLLVAGVLGLWVGGYLWLHERGAAAPGPEGAVSPAATAVAEAPEGRTAPTAEAAGTGAEAAGGTAATARAAPAAGTAPTAEAAGPGARVEGRVEAGTAVAGTPEIEADYLPHASIWPFAIGLGGAGVGVGMAIGLWVLVPGLGILVLGIGGFVRQTRRRD